MDLKCSLPFSQEAATGAYVAELQHSSPQPHILFP
jgi:hypothetical protein